MSNSIKFTYGNFDHYYNPSDTATAANSVHERLNMLPADWFKGKKVLDIGCNDGTFTLAMTLNFTPELVIGVDIDNKLISRAIKNIHKVTNDLLVKSVVDGISENESEEVKKDDMQVETTDERQQKILSNIESLPRSLRLSLSLPSVTKALTTQNEVMGQNISSIKNFLYERLTFRTENYVASLEPFETYHTVVCFKTIKWVHMNFGDAGVKALFHKVYQSLEPEGLFIFDSVNWKSYKKRKGMNKDLKKNFEAIEFKPGEFDTYLKTKVGFVFKEALKPEDETKRPLLVYQRPAE